MNDEKITDLVYKAKLNDKVFEFGFAEETNDGIIIKAQFDLNADEFKIYLKSLIKLVAKYSIENNRNLIEEILNEDE